MIYIAKNGMTTPPLTLKITKWGDSLGVNIPNTIVRALKLEAQDVIIVTITTTNLVGEKKQEYYGNKKPSDETTFEESLESNVDLNKTTPEVLNDDNQNRSDK